MNTLLKMDLRPPFENKLTDAIDKKFPNRRECLHMLGIAHSTEWPYSTLGLRVTRYYLPERNRVRESEITMNQIRLALQEDLHVWLRS